MNTCELTYCDRPLRTFRGKPVGTTCDHHTPLSKGTGETIMCNICDQPQSVHSRSFYEHARLAAIIKTARGVINDRR